MVRCKKCGVTTSNSKAVNWQRWQLCYSCAKKEHPECYADLPNHGTGKSRMQAPAKAESIYEFSKHANTMRQAR